MLRAIMGIILLAGTLALAGCGEKQTDVAPDPLEREAEALIARGLDVNARDSDYWTPLCRAAGAGRVHDVQVLLLAKADVNATSALGRSPLRLAAGGGYREEAELLIKAGADVNARDDDGRTPLHAAASGEREFAVPVHGIGTDGEPRTLESSEGFQSRMSESEMQQLIRDKQAIAQMLIDAKADVNASDDIQPNGMTPLYIAARYGCKEVSELLIKAGANVNALSDYGMTPLHAAAYGLHKEIIEGLIKAGANVNAKDNEGGTALHRAVFHTSFCQHPTTDAELQEDLSRTAEVAQLLISYGADVKAKNSIGEAPLHLAAEFGYTEVVGMLLKAGAKVNVGSPLALAAKRGHVEAVELLLKAGANPNPPYDHGDTLLRSVTFLCSAERAKIAKLLLKAGAHVNGKDRWHGGTALHYAVRNCRDKELVEMLIKAGAHVNAKTNEGQTPLALALEVDDKEMADLLRRHGATE